MFNGKVDPNNLPPNFPEALREQIAQGGEWIMSQSKEGGPITVFGSPEVGGLMSWEEFEALSTEEREAMGLEEAYQQMLALPEARPMTEEEDAAYAAAGRSPLVTSSKRT